MFIVAYIVIGLVVAWVVARALVHEDLKDIKRDGYYGFNHMDYKMTVGRLWINILWGLTCGAIWPCTVTAGTIVAAIIQISKFVQKQKGPDAQKLATALFGSPKDKR